MKIELYGNSGELQKTLFVNRVNADEYKILYQIINPFTELTGEVEIELTNLETFIRTNEPVSRVLEEFVYRDEAIAEIKKFYPHAFNDVRGLSVDQQRKGVGTAVLNTVMQDLINNGINNFYVINPKVPFKNLLLKQRYRMLYVDDYEKNNHMFKRVSSI